VIVQDVVPPLLIFAGIGIIGFVAYKWITSEFGGAGDDSQGANPDGTKNKSVLDAILNGTLTIGPGTETYTTALGQTLTNPIGAIKSIFGVNPN
jgi:hypothetical protein